MLALPILYYLNRFILSLCAKRVYGFHTGGSSGRVKTEKHTDGCGEQGGQDDRSRLHF